MQGSSGSKKQVEPGVVIITGGTRGIGLGIAKRLTKEGYSLLLTYRDDAAQAKKAREEVLALPGTGGVQILQADVTASGVGDIVIAEATKLGTVWGLVNNAGTTIDKPFLRMTEEQWLKVIDTNLNSVYRMSRPFAKHLIMAQRTSGAIVNISSVVGRGGNPMQANYAAAKAGMLGVTWSLAQELGRSGGIRVNAITPGFIDTRLTEVLPDPAKAALLERTPLGRFGTPEDIAGVVAFLLGPDSAFMNGAVLDVNGGLYMG